MCFHLRIWLETWPRWVDLTGELTEPTQIPTQINFSSFTLRTMTWPTDHDLILALISAFLFLFFLGFDWRLDRDERIWLENLLNLHKSPHNSTLELWLETYNFASPITWISRFPRTIPPQNMTWPLTIMWFYLLYRLLFDNSKYIILFFSIL